MIFKKALVIGAGQMGSGIAQVFATKGVHVHLVDLSETSLQNARSKMEKSVEKLFAKGGLSPHEADNFKKGLFISTSLEVARDVDLVVEAINEDENLKRGIFQKLDAIAPTTTIFASNTSSLPITRLAAATKRADRFIGMHFMNPVPIMKLVEVISGLATSEDTKSKVLSFIKALDKESCHSKDFPGFIVNRILMPMINEAFTALYEGIADAHSIDVAMRLGTNQPMGPLALADFIGLDTCLAIMRVLHQGLGDSKYRPSPLLIQYVDAGRFGRKTGKGVFEY